MGAVSDSVSFVLLLVLSPFLVDGKIFNAEGLILSGALGVSLVASLLFAYAAA